MSFLIYGKHIKSRWKYLIQTQQYKIRHRINTVYPLSELCIENVLERFVEFIYCIWKYIYSFLLIYKFIIKHKCEELHIFMWEYFGCYSHSPFLNSFNNYGLKMMIQKHMLIIHENFLRGFVFLFGQYFKIEYNCARQLYTVTTYLYPVTRLCYTSGGGDPNVSYLISGSVLDKK